MTATGISPGDLARMDESLASSSVNFDALVAAYRQDAAGQDPTMAVFALARGILKMKDDANSLQYLIDMVLIGVKRAAERIDE